MLKTVVSFAFASVVLAVAARAQAIPLSVHEVDRLDDGRTLITDGGTLNDSVPGICFLVEPDGTLVHSFDARTLWTHSAKKLDGWNILVTDTNNDRIVVIAPDGSITWDSDSVSPFSDGSVLQYPNDADPLPNGNMLVCDRDNHRVFELDQSGVIRWQFGVTGVAGNDATHLNGPHNPNRLPNGNTLIADSNNDRILEVTPGGAIAWVFAPAFPNDLDWPRDAEVTPAGHVVVGDSRHDRLVLADRSTGAVLGTIPAGQLPYDVDPLPNGNYLVGGGTAREVTPAGAVVWQYPVARTAVVSSPLVVNPSTGVALNVRVYSPSDASAANRRPAVVMVPGGSAGGSTFAGQCEQFARVGFVACWFDPDGRGLSTNGGAYTVENYNGHLQQDGLRQVLLHLASRAEVDATRLCAYTNSYGITMASGMISRYPSDPAVAVLLDWEGPMSRAETAAANGGHVPVSPANNAFWSQREAITFLPLVPSAYLRLQSQTDHIAASHPVNFHAIDAANAALQAAFGGLGVARSVRVNSELMNPADRPWSTSDQPAWIAENLQNTPYMRHRVQLMLQRALHNPTLSVGGTVAPGSSFSLDIAGGVARAGLACIAGISGGAGPTPVAGLGWATVDVDDLLIHTLRVGALDAAGAISELYAVPNEPALSGFTVFAQGLVSRPADPIVGEPTFCVPITIP